MILFEYEPMEDVKDTPRMLVLTTLIVRIIALTTAVLASTFVNFIASGWAVKSIFTARYFPCCACVCGACGVCDDPRVKVSHLSVPTAERTSPRR